MPLLDDGKASTDGVGVGGCEHCQIALHQLKDGWGQPPRSCLRNLIEVVGDASALVGCRLVEQDRPEHALDLEQVADLTQSADELGAIRGQPRIDRVRDPVDVRADQT